LESGGGGQDDWGVPPTRAPEAQVGGPASARPPGAGRVYIRAWPGSEGRCEHAALCLTTVRHCWRLPAAPVSTTMRRLCPPPNFRPGYWELKAGDSARTPAGNPLAARTQACSGPNELPARQAPNTRSGAHQASASANTVQQELVATRTRRRVRPAGTTMSAGDGAGASTGTCL
jgi:hypothetical protein